MRFVLLLAAVLCLASAARAGVIYDATVDFSTSSNPNGAWAFGHSDALTGAMTVYPDFATQAPDQIWRDNAHVSLGAPAVWTDTNLGTLNFHPGPSGMDNYSIIRWTAPADGVADLDAVFNSINTGSKTVHVYHNATPLYESFVAGTVGSFLTASHSESLDVLAGDVLFVAVGRDTDNFFSDATRVGFTIDFTVPEPASLGLMGLGGLLVLRRRGR
jgi:hypothetical protein